MVGVIWDIQAEHLDEAEFLLEMWTNCVDSPNYTLATLHDGPEQRLFAHVEGLVVGREPVIERLLVPVVEDPDDEFRTAAATLAILQGGGVDACAKVLHAFESAEPEGHRGVVRGLIHARRSGLIQWLAGDLDRQIGPALIGRLLVLAGHRVDAGARLVGWLRADDLELRRAAAVLARHTASTEALGQLVLAMSDADDALRWAAIESGLIRGLPNAWERVCKEAFAKLLRPAHRRAALAWVAMLGDQATHRRLLADLAVAPTPELIWAVGQSGRPAAVDSVIELLDHPELARLAAEVVCHIAGLSTADERYWLDRGARVGDDELDGLPELDDDELDVELAPTGDDALRLPNPAEIRSWWAQRRAGLDPDVRHLCGRRLDAEQLARGLRELATRARHSLALELAARTRGRAQIVSDAMAAVQYQQMEAALTGLDSVDLQRGLPLV